MKSIPEKVLTILSFILTLAVLTAGIWMFAALPVVLNKVPRVLTGTVQCLAVVLFIMGFRAKSFHIMLLILEVTFAMYFAMLTPAEQFKDVKFQRVFAVKPQIKYLDDDTFEVIDLRKNRYQDDYDERDESYDDRFVNETFSFSKAHSMQLAMVYWNNMDLAAHTMLNFIFSDGRELTVSVEPRTPAGVDREPFTCLCKQQELLFILSDTGDLFDLRSRIRGEDLYVYDTTFSAAEVQQILRGIIGKTHDIYHAPEFYDLLKANCITALLPHMKAAKKELKWDIRCILNGRFDRLCYEQGVLKCRENESFESLKSRSFIKGKSQGKL
ncbi:MAG: DUF4105 domain-containing protein [Lentisphaerae bacterium]|nr:DUF4105 domain-containing protein [Lentisphaerota bacterium]